MSRQFGEYRPAIDGNARSAILSAGHSQPRGGHLAAVIDVAVAAMVIIVLLPFIFAFLLLMWRFYPRDLFEG